MRSRTASLFHTPLEPMSKTAPTKASAKQKLPSCADTIIHVAIGELNPAPYNPRTWDDAALEQLCTSIRHFGFLDPAVINAAPGRKNVVISGHMRIAAAKKIGMKTIPCLQVNIPDVEREKELNIRMNANQGRFDPEKLIEFFGFEDLETWGFDIGSLAHVWDDLLQTEDDSFDVEKELANIEDPRTKPGDVYQLGVHRLVCGDATDLDVVRKLCGTDHVDMVYTDIPYNINLDYSGGVGGNANYGGTTDDNKTDEEYADFVRKILGNALSVAKKDCHCFLWCDQSYVYLLQQLYRELGLDFKRTCLWIKNVANATPKTAFNKVYEPVVYGIRGAPYLSDKQLNLTEILNKEIGTGNRAIDDILDYLDIWLVKRLPGNEYAHATQKPPTLHEKPLRRCTRPGDIVLDLTAGSGSTLISCEQMKRKALLCEIEPRFCDLIIHRYEELTGISATPLAS